MTCHSMYVGSLANFDWDSREDVNLPGPLTAMFPPTSDYHGALTDWAKRNNVFHAKTDFDGWVARATKAQILTFVAEQASKSWYPRRWDAVRAEIEALEDATEYGLVSECY